MIRSEYRDPGRKAALCDELVEVELLAAEARQRGLHTAVATRLRLDEQLSTALLTSELDKASALDDAALRAYYEQHRAEFERPEQRRARLIALNAPETDSALRAEKEQKAQSLRETLDKDMKVDPFAFQRVAREMSDHVSRTAAGDLGLRNSTDFEAVVESQVADAIRSLGPGGLSPVVSTPSGFFLATVEVVLPPASTPFEVVRTQIADRAATERKLQTRKALVAGLRERAAVTIDDAQLKTFAPGS